MDDFRRYLVARKRRNDKRLFPTLLFRFRERARVGTKIGSGKKPGRLFLLILFRLREGWRERRKRKEKDANDDPAKKGVRRGRVSKLSKLDRAHPPKKDVENGRIHIKAITAFQQAPPPLPPRRGGVMFRGLAGIW